MTNFTPTPEQQAIVAAAAETKDNLLISALAGAAKTSTLVLIANALPSVNILCLAFNKRIADEMRERLPTNCEALTLNSVGHRAWGQYLGRRLNLDTKKTYTLVREEIESLTNKEERDEAFGLMSDIMRNVDYGKAMGWVPDGHFPQAKRLMDDAEFFACLDEEPSPLEQELLITITVRSIKLALQGTIDFGDQLFMPTLWGAIFPYYPLVLVDEAQDLSPLNHFMLRKLARKRLIAVGDACQGIYGFRGADEDSMTNLLKSFSMQELHLTISFRCPIAVVREAQWRAPHMKWPEWAAPGEVRTLASWSVEDIPNSAAIICRNNAPLFSMALRLLRDGRYPELIGNDVAKSLIKILRKLSKDLALPRTEVLALIDDWKKEKLARARNRDRVNDTAACLEIFAREGETLKQAIEYAERVMSVAGPVKLMTGHKSKGLEFDNVFFLDQDLIKDSQQDKNLRYVIQTRAKSTLTYVTSSSYDSEKEILS